MPDSAVGLAMARCGGLDYGGPSFLWLQRSTTTAVMSSTVSTKLVSYNLAAEFAPLNLKSSMRRTRHPDGVKGVGTGEGGGRDR